MRYSKYYIPTLKEAPNDAEIVSHKLLIRAGMIRKLTSGVYSWLPFGLRSLNKSSQIVREEMNKAGALETFLPTAQPADLWKESGRWEQYGKELLRFNDRHDRECCLGPTHEEVMTDLIRHEVRSYRQLPLNLYQIQTKFRDEIRPRFGIMRGREFLMKDAYSFDATDEGADISYKNMYEAYRKIFTRMGLKFRAVEADSGSIGGNFSHEFMVLAETGEDTIAYCNECAWSSNIERARVVQKDTNVAEQLQDCKEIETPKQHTIAELCEFLSLSADKFAKTLLYVADGKIVAVLVRGDRELNEIKLKNYLDATELEMASPEQVIETTNAPVGFAGPIGLKVKIIADNELMNGSYICGANKADAHTANINLKRDVSTIEFADLRFIADGDLCPNCSGSISFAKGIEVGHVFKLGTKYSKAMNCVFTNEQGQEEPMIMGCYGIGVSRVIAACIEQNHDEFGIVFPPALAPFEITILNLDPKNEQVNNFANEVYEKLGAQNIEVLIDDRTERPGIKFKDADLMGIPMQIIVGAKALANNTIEVKDRKTNEKTMLSLDNFYEELSAWRTTILNSWSNNG